MDFKKKMFMNSDINKVFKYSRLLIVPQTYLALMGVWRLNLTNLLPIYNIYFFVSHGYLLAFIGLQIYQAALLFIRNSWGEFTANLTISILYSVSVFQAYFCRSTSMSKLTDKVELIEKKIEEDNDEAVKSIYDKHVKIARISGLCYIVMGWTPLSLYFYHPHLPILNDLDLGSNATIEQKYLIFSVWFPFDKYQRYRTAYMLQVLGGIFGGSYSISTDALFFSLFIFCISYVKILQHYLRDLDKYAKILKMEEKMDLDKAEVIITKRCIVMYQDIIEFVGNLDEMLRTFMLFNFFQASFKMSLLLLQILANPSFGISSFSIFTYVVYLLVQLYFFYWNANEILFETSDGIILAISNSNWYITNQEVKKLLLFTLLRAKRPCKIGIGSFYDMNLQAVINILRACYYYVCVMHDFDE